MPRNPIGVGLVLLVTSVLYWPDTAALGRYWRDQDVNAQAGILIALLAVFLLYRARQRVQQASVAPAPWACLPLILCAAASLICWRAGILTLQLLFLPPILWLAVLAVMGPQVARAAAIPIGFLYFALPGWGLLASTLQRLTAWAVGVIGPVIGLPVSMSGTTASLPGGVTFVIERACSGVDFLTVGLAVAAFYGELEQAKPRRRLGLIGGMLVLAILSNWLRVMLIIEIGYHSQMRNALATRDHLALGWIVFACALLAFVWTAARRGDVSAPAAPVASRGTDAVSRASPSRGHARWRYGVIAAALPAVPVLVYASSLMTQGSAGAAAFELPPGHAPWHGLAESTDLLWKPEFVGAYAQRRARYQGVDGRAIEVVAFGFPQQRQGAQILNERNSLLGDSGLSIEAVSLVDGADIPYGEVITLDAEGRRSIIWSIIDIGGRLFGEPLYSQLWYGVRSLAGTPYSALFALRAQCDGSCDAARVALRDFLEANGPALFASLPK